MRRSEVLRTLEDVEHLLADVKAAMPNLLPTLEQHRGGYPATASGASPLVFGGGASSPVERLALTRDPAADARRDVDASVAAMHAEALKLWRVIAAWRPTWDLRTAGPGIDGCAWCDAVPAWQTTAKGNVAPTMLCRPCARFVLAQGRKPSRGELLRKQAGGRLRASL